MFDLGPGGLAKEDAPSAVPEPRAIAAAPDTPAAPVPAPAAAPDVQATPTTSAPFEDRRTLAVLPFVNLSGEAVVLASPLPPRTKSPSRSTATSSHSPTCSTWGGFATAPVPERSIGRETS